MPAHFGFHLPTKIEVGNGILSSVGRLARATIGGNKCLIITDAGIRASGLADEAYSSLREAGYDCEWFDRVEPNPKDRDCEAGGQAARLFGADIIAAVGGGSVIDSAKAIALLQSHEGHTADYEGRNKVKYQVTPLVAVPTTAGTGSEVTRSAVITDTGRKFKMTLKDVRLAPRLAVMDPETTLALPANLTASTGMDALVHAIEAYTCRLANPVSDALALAAMELIFPSLTVAVKNGKNLSARERMMVGSLLAGLAFSHADVAAVHCMAEALGGLYDTPHGVANSMFLAAVTAYNAAADPEKHARIAAACGLPVQSMPAKEAAAMLVEQVSLMAEDIGIPKFSSLPYANPLDFEKLAQAAANNGSTPSNCREIGRNEYLKLFHESYVIK